MARSDNLWSDMNWNQIWVKLDLKVLFFLCFFSLQIYLVIARINEEEKFFNWAMYHTDIRYSATVNVNGLELSNHDFIRRYKFSMKGQECRGLGNLKRKIILREKYMDKNDTVIVELNYTENTFEGFWKWSNEP